MPPEFNDDRQVIKNLLKGLVGLIVIALIVWLYRQQTTGELSDKISTLEQENRELRTHNDELVAQNNELINDKLTKQQAAAIQKVTNTQLLAQLNDLQNNAIELDKELSFYQNIMQGNATTKLQIRELKVTVDDKQANQFNYRLVISQGKKITTPLTGQLTISITGNINKALKTIELNTHPLKLRHVQVFNGQINLPANMVPKSIKVTLIQNKKTILSKTIDWKVTPNQLTHER